MISSNNNDDKNVYDNKDDKLDGDNINNDRFINHVSGSRNR